MKRDAFKLGPLFCENKHLSSLLIAKGKYSLCPFPMLLLPSKMKIKTS